MDTIKDRELTRTRLAARVAEQGPPANHSRTQRQMSATPRLQSADPTVASHDEDLLTGWSRDS
jgi:hypothetical protein